MSFKDPLNKSSLGFYLGFTQIPGVLLNLQQAKSFLSEAILQWNGYAVLLITHLINSIDLDMNDFCYE